MECIVQIPFQTCVSAIHNPDEERRESHCNVGILVSEVVLQKSNTVGFAVLCQAFTDPGECQLATYYKKGLDIKAIYIINMRSHGFSRVFINPNTTRKNY